MPNQDKIFFRNALDAMKDLVIIKGDHSRLLWANKAFLNYYGMTEEEMYQIVDGPQSNPDDTLQYVRDDQAVMDSGEHVNIPSENVTDSTGGVKAFHTIKSPVFKNNKVVQVMTVSRLIHDEHITNTSYNHADAKMFSSPLRGITTNFPIPMILLDLKTRVVSCSPKWLKEFGDFDQNSSDNFFTQIYPELDKLSDLIARSLKGEGTQDFTLSIGKLIQQKHFHFRVDSWSYPNKVRGGVTITASDITSIIRNNEELRRSNEDLDSFAYSACHDLKSPLKAVNHLAKWIQNDSENHLSKQSQEDFELLQGRVKRMNSMLESLFLYSQVGRKEVSSGQINIEALTKELSKNLEHPPSYKIRFTNEPISFIGNLVPFEIVLRNLVENAIKHRSNDNGEVEIAATKQDGYTTVSVSDNGPGIPLKHRERVFGLFKTLKPRDDFESNGIGLALVKKLVEREGGSISISDGKGSGVCFTYTWPLTRPEERKKHE